MPAKTGLHGCAINENKCRDGSARKVIYPVGHQQF